MGRFVGCAADRLRWRAGFLPPFAVQLQWRGSRFSHFILLSFLCFLWSSSNREVDLFFSFHFAQFSLLLWSSCNKEVEFFLPIFGESFFCAPVAMD